MRCQWRFEGGLSLDASRWVRPYGDGWLRAHGTLKMMWALPVQARWAILLTRLPRRPARRAGFRSFSAAGSRRLSVSRETVKRAFLILRISASNGRS